MAASMPMPRIAARIADKLTKFTRNAVWHLRSPEAFRLARRQGHRRVASQFTVQKSCIMMGYRDRQSREIQHFKALSGMRDQ